MINKNSDLPPTDGTWTYDLVYGWFSMLNGHLHNSLGPAFIYDDGRKHWCVNGKLHRLDGPAIINDDGTKQWWVDDKLHRLDGPAIECADGSKEWWESGRRHRLDGPAAVTVDGTKWWYVNGQGVSEQDYFFAVISFLLGVDKETAELIEQEMKL